VRRAIRHGDPSPDPILRHIEIADGAVIARLYGWLVLAMGLLGGFILVFVATDDLATTRIRLLSVAVTVVLIGYLTWCLVTWFAARRFLRGPKR